MKIWKATIALISGGGAITAIWLIICIIDPRADFQNPPPYFRSFFIDIKSYSSQNPELLIGTITLLSALLVFSFFAKTNNIKDRFRHIRKDNLVFFDKPNGKLSEKWELPIPWEISDKGEIVVTGHFKAGLIDKGIQWENYNLSFDAKIITHCLGVVVRAISNVDGFMLQIKPNEIVPHRFRPIIPNISNVISDIDWGQRPSKRHELRIKDWFKCEIIVRGNRMILKINGDTVYNEDATPIHPMGRAGFRNWNEETALIKNIEVQLL